MLELEGNLNRENYHIQTRLKLNVKQCKEIPFDISKCFYSQGIYDIHNIV